LNTSKTTFAFVALLVSTALVGCAAESEESAKTADAPAAAAPIGQSTAELQAQIDGFTKAVVERDAAALSGIVSKEIHARIGERGTDLGGFLEKQRSTLMRTFSLAEGERPAFEIAEVLPEGDAVRVTLRFRGEDLKKPFYFVRENGALRVNIAPPGFAKAAPDGALFGRSNYQIHNVNIRGNAPFTLSCYGLAGGTVTVAAQSTKKVSCIDNCGFWSGTQFQGPNGRIKSCDWNSWGDDVIINLLDADGWRCNDGC
jgi:hypothetical protein